MATFLHLIANIMNYLHDTIINICNNIGLSYTDKSLHFWVFGFIGIVIFFISDLVFKWLSKLSISIVSFIYTLTVLIVLAFSLEIAQKVTSRGNMQLSDIVYGIWGFIVIFAIYVSIKILFIFFVKQYNKYYRKN